MEDYYFIWRALRSLKRMDSGGLDMLIYYGASDLVLSPVFMAGYMREAYGAFFRFGESGYAGFRSGFGVSGPVFFPVMDFIWEGLPLRGMLYGTRLRPGGEASLFFLLREERIRELFSPDSALRGGLYIYGPGGALLFSSGGGLPPPGGPGALPPGSGLLDAGFFDPETIGAYAWSAHGLLFVSALEAEVALSHARTLRNLTLALNGAAIILSLGCAAVLAARNSRWAAEAFRLLEGAPNLPPWEGGNVLAYLANSVSRLVKTNTLLREDADSRRETLRSAFLDRLLGEGWDSRDEAEAAAEQAGIFLGGRRFSVVFFVLKNREAPAGNGDFAPAREAVLEALGSALEPGEALLYRRHPSRLGLFFFLDRRRWGGFREYMESFFLDRAAPLCGERGAELFPVGSGLLEDPLKLREAYNLCREYALVRGGERGESPGIHWIDTLPPPRRRVFVFPPEAEQKLINQLQNADFEGARQSLRSIFAANTGEGLLGERMLSIFYAGLQGCFLKALEDPLTERYRDPIGNLDLRRPSGEMEEGFTALAREICGAFAAEYAGRNALIRREELTAYVEEHFGEERLSLRLAARHFGFSEAYFSQMFKEITGENFSSFTEITRLNHARSLLLGEYLKVEEVAYRCGYKSPHSFRRAYKRCFGVNPARSR
jgi:AraC-like DNA-binding protein